MDVRTSLATQTYAAARPAVLPQAEGGETGFVGFAASFASTLAESERTAKSAMIGDADPHALVQALAASQLAVETVATVRDKVVEAYQEILRMPV